MAYIDHAAALWPLLVSRAPDKATLTYSEVADFLGHRNPRLVGRALHPIVLACSDEGWPVVTALVVNATTGRPGAGLDPWIDDFAAELDRIAAFDWRQVVPPLPLPEIIAEIDPSSFRVEDSVVQAKTRGPFQEHFRQVLMDHYDGRCALCDIRLERLLVAAHIVPWSADPDHRLNPRNGILLCRTHHVLLDEGIVRVHADLSVEVKTPKDELGEDLTKILDQRTASTLRRPGRASPDPELLDRKLRAFEASD